MVYIIGHRGVPFHATENTIAGFQRALDLGIPAIELDVRNTKDNVPIVFHDKTLNRLTNSRGWVHRRTASELSRIALAQGERIPTLQAALDLITEKATAVIELKAFKTASITEKIARMVAEHPNRERIVIGSFLPWRLKQMKALHPEIKTAMYYDHYFPFAPVYTAKRIKADVVLSSQRLLNKARIMNFHNAKLKVGAWTVNSIPEVKSLVEKGVDAVITDFPDQVLEIFRPFHTKTLL